MPAEHRSADPFAVVDALNAAGGRVFLRSCLIALDLLRGPAGDRRAVLDAIGERPQRLGDVPRRRPAAEGTTVADAVWRAYLLHETDAADADAWLRQSIDALDPVALVFTANDNPEPWWQSEMIILHALHSFALRSRDNRLIDRTLACADYHLREIQPDHATNEPWSVHAYASHADGNVTAETLWHAAHIQHGGRPGEVARQLARDASAALAAFLAA